MLLEIDWRKQEKGDKKNEHPPAMHNAMGWCKHGYINQMDKLASNRFQGIAGRSNPPEADRHRTLQRRTSVEGEKMNNQTYNLQ